MDRLETRHFLVSPKISKVLHSFLPFLVLGLVPRSFLPFLLSKVGPEMGEDIDVVLEKGKVLHIKTLTPGIEVGDLHHDVLDSSICVFDA